MHESIRPLPDASGANMTPLIMPDAPDDPHALMRCIERRILDQGDFKFIPLVRTDIKKAIAVSHRRIATGMHLPEAWYDIGFFEMLLGRNYKSLDAFGKGMLAAASDQSVETAFALLTEIQQRADGTEPRFFESLTWLRAFFKLILAVRRRRSSSRLPCDTDSRQVGDVPLSICVGLSDAPPFHPSETIVIVAGACARSSEAAISDYQTVVASAFSGFHGVIVSGGTTAGISGVVGDIPDPEGAIRKIAYLPSGRPPADLEHPGYQRIITTTRGTYSPLDPIILWSDLLACRVDPKNVRLLGISGGELSGFEYRLALLMGANVGVIPESGRAALEIASDPAWCRAGLFRLSKDLETIRAFLQANINLIDL